MNWDAVGAIGELIGSLTVLITLVYLAIQIRHSRELLQRNEKLSLGQAFQSRVDARRDIEKIVIDMADVVSKVQKGGFTNLDDVEKVKYRQLMALWHDFWDNSLYQESLGFESAVVEDYGQTLANLNRLEASWKTTGITLSPRVTEWIARKKKKKAANV